jgi:hypothetical protein
LPDEQPREPAVERDRLPLADHHADREGAHPESLHGGHPLVRLQRLSMANRQQRHTGRAGAPPCAEHHADIRPVDVGVEQPDATTEPRQRDREIDRDRALAHAALAAADRNDVSRGLVSIVRHIAPILAICMMR